MGKGKDTGNKRTPDQKAADLEFIANQRIQGRTLREIADDIGKIRPYSLSYVQVSLDMKKVKEMWAESAKEALAAGQERVLAALDAVERAAWESFQKSRGIKVTTRKKSRVQKRRGKAGAPAPAILVPVEETTDTDDRAGNPEFLEIVVSVQRERVKVFGLAAPKKLTLGGDDAAPLVPATVSMAPATINVHLPQGYLDPFHEPEPAPANS